MAGAASAVLTANAWRPFVRSGYGTALGFPSGIVPTELPLPSAVAALVPAAVAARRGGLGSIGGRVGLALTGASIAGLVALDRSARADRKLFEAALSESLGADHRRRMAEVVVPPRRVASDRLRLVPRTGRRSPYLAVRNVAYGDAGRRNLLDIWRHPDLAADASAPVIVHVHGGAWVSGNKTIQGIPLLSHLASRGFVGVSINYRLSPRAAWPAAIVDVKRALAWVRANIATHGGDPSFIAITGGSAGGHLSSLAALTANVAELQPGFEAADTSVQAAVPLYGVYDLTDVEGAGHRELGDFWRRVVLREHHPNDHPVWQTASPLLNVHGQAPPMFVIHGTNDALVRVEQARLLVSTLRDAEAPVVAYAELPHARHSFDIFDTERTRSMAEAAERFLRVALAGHRAMARRAASKPESSN